MHFPLSILTIFTNIIPIYIPNKSITKYNIYIVNKNGHNTVIYLLLVVYIEK